MGIEPIANVCLTPWCNRYLLQVLGYPVISEISFVLVGKQLHQARAASSLSRRRNKPLRALLSVS